MGETRAVFHVRGNVEEVIQVLIKSVRIIIIIYSLNIAPFNIKMIESALHEFKNIYQNTKTIMNYKKYYL